MILGIVETLNEWVAPARSWIESNHDNPIMWIAFFLIGLAVFAITYSALNKDH